MVPPVAVPAAGPSEPRAMEGSAAATEGNVAATEGFYGSPQAKDSGKTMVQPILDGRLLQRRQEAPVFIEYICPVVKEIMAEHKAALASSKAMKDMPAPITQLWRTSSISQFAVKQRYGLAGATSKRKKI